MRFRVTNKQDWNCGKIGTVDKDYKTIYYDYALKFDNSHWNVYSKWEVEEVKDNFQINDKVKVIDKNSKFYNQTGTIVNLNDSNNWIILFSSVKRWYFNECDLEIVISMPIRKLTDNDIESGYIKLCDFDIKSIKNTGIFLFITYTDGDIKPLCMELEIEVK